MFDFGNNLRQHGPYYTHRIESFRGAKRRRRYEKFQTCVYHI